jgi:hypothetical protein
MGGNIYNHQIIGDFSKFLARKPKFMVFIYNVLENEYI